MCGDYYCSSCGPAQGNYKCENCGAWSQDGGCKDPQKCADAIHAYYEAMYQEHLNESDSN